MYIFFADEADQDKTQDGTFFIYGGAIIKSEHLPSITAEIDNLRKDFDFHPDHSLKFSPHDKPNHLDNEQFISCKEKVFQIATEHEVRFIGYAFNNNCGKNIDYRKKIEWGADQLLAKFNRFLADNDSFGLVAFDQMPLKSHRDYLKSKFGSRGENSDNYKAIDRILAYTTCYDRTSHLASIADIFVGSFRMIVNNPERDKAGRTLAKQLKKVFAQDPSDLKRRKISEYSLVIRPRAEGLRVPAYAQQNINLRTRILGWMNEGI